MPGSRQTSPSRIRILFVAGTKGLLKSLLISAFVMVPGMVLISRGMTLPGMFWLFAGSFGMMAWTYRRPWRLMRVSCLLPPLGSAIAYAIQFSLFGRQRPPLDILLVGAGVGLGVGYLRAHSHAVFRKDGAIYAQRTIGYLLLWVATYGATQGFGYLGKNVYLVQGGLVTGAFSTAMLTVVSLVLWKKLSFAKAAVGRASTAAVCFGLLFGLLLASSQRLDAAGRYPDEIFDLILPRGQALEWPGHGTIPESSSNGSVMRDELDAESGIHLSGEFRTFLRRGDDRSFTIFMIAVMSSPDPGGTEMMNRQLAEVREMVKNDPDIQSLVPNARMREQLTPTLPELPHAQMLTFTGANAEKSLAIASVDLAYNGWALLVVGADGGAGPLGGREAEVNRFVRELAVKFARRIPVLTLEVPDEFSGGEEVGAANEESADLPAPEEIAKVTAAIAAVLVAAGVGIQLANSIAAALAQAIQSGVDLTVEEVVEAVDRAGRKRSGGAPGTKPHRPRGPILRDKEGEAFARNKTGHYWAPDPHGEWKWMDEAEARQASNALRQERRDHAGEQQLHDQETRRILEEARREREMIKDAEAIFDREDRRRTARAKAEAAAESLMGDLLGEAPAAEEPPPDAPPEPPIDPALRKEIEQLATRDGKLDPTLEAILREELAPREQAQAGPPSIPAVPTSYTPSEDPPVESKAPTENPPAAQADSPAPQGADDASSARAAAEARAKHLLDDLMGDGAPTEAREAPASATETTGSPPPSDAETAEAASQPADPTEPGKAPVDPSPSAETAADGDGTSATGAETTETATAAADEPLRDPRSGDVLETDAEGRVKYGDQWLPPEEAARKVAIDAEWHQRQGAGRERIDHFKATLKALDSATDPGERARLEAELRQQAAEMNGDYAAKNLLKAEGRTETGAAFDRIIHDVYKDVDERVLAELNARGYTRGGRPLTQEDIIEFRNAASAGTVGIDRDVGLNETAYREALEAMRTAKPGSPEAIEAARRLAGARAQGKLTLDPQRYDQFLSSRRDAVIETAVELRGRLATMHRPSPEAESVQQELARLEGEIKTIDRQRADFASRVERANALKEAKIAELEHHRDSLPEDSPRRSVVDESIARLRSSNTLDVSPGAWNEAAQSSYNEQYHGVTGQSPEAALQVVTTGKHPEAFEDANVLEGVSADNPPNPALAEQTASVPRIKEAENRHLAEAGHLTAGQAMQETARGYAKDMKTKLTPLLESDPNVDPAKLENLRKIQDVFDRAGRGEIPPGQIEGELRKALPDIPDLDLAKATRIVDANFEAAIKWRKPAATKGDWGAHLSTALDAQAVVDDFKKYVESGMSVEDAAFVASTKALAGAQLGAQYGSMGGIGMASALMPEGARKLVPDQFAGELVEGGHKVLKGLVQDLAERVMVGETDFNRFNEAAERAGDGNGVIGSYMKFVRFVGEEAAKVDAANPQAGDLQTVAATFGNLYNELRDLQASGDLAIQRDIMLAQAKKYASGKLAEEALRGDHGVPLQGYAAAAELAGELVTDPGQVARDLASIWQNLGDPEMMKETIEHTDRTLRNTPIAGTVYGGWKNLGDLATKAEARTEAWEGAQALAGEAWDLFNASSRQVATELHRQLFE